MCQSGSVCCRARPQLLAGHWHDAISGGCLSGQSWQNRVSAEHEQPPWLCKPESVRSRKRYFEHLRPWGNRDRRRLEPEFQCFFRIANRFFLGIASGRAPGQLRKESRPSFALRIMLDHQPQFHFERIVLSHGLGNLDLFSPTEIRSS